MISGGWDEEGRGLFVLGFVLFGVLLCVIDLLLFLPAK